MHGINFESLEAYLLTEDKQEYINRLIPNTEPHSYFSLLYNLQNSPTLTKEVQTQVTDYHQVFQSSSSKSIFIRSLLKQFDEPSTSAKDKTEIINKLIQQLGLGLNFNYYKPSNIQSSALNQNQEKLPSILDQKVVTFDPKKPEYYSDYYSFNTLQPEAHTRLDTSKILSGDQRVLENFLSSAQAVDYPNFPELITKNALLAPYYKPDFNALPLEQLQSLAKQKSTLHWNSDSSFISALFKKTFGAGSFDMLIQGMTRKERRDLAFKIYTWAKDSSNSTYSYFEGLVCRALYEVLQLDQEQNKFDKELFIEYLKNPSENYRNTCEEHQKVLRNRGRASSPISFGVIRIDADLLVETYLEEFFKDAKDISPFDKYLEKKYLTQLLYSTRLVLGKPLESSKALTPEAAKELIDSKELKICRYNQDYFKGYEPVELTLSLKNIPSLMVKVFEFHTENFYLKEQKGLDGTTNLDGLIAAQEFNLTFSEPPSRRFLKKISFDSISEKKQGTFIVDFIGNGLSSRALIRKGKLSILESQTVAGQVFTLVDEKGEICKEDRVGMWIKGIFYRADALGRIIVPFVDSNSTEKTIVVNKDYAEMTNVLLKSQVFKFQCSYIYNYESFLMGNKAKVLLQPKLFLNQEPVSLDVIQECNATVTTLNADQIPTQTDFKKIKLGSTEEVELEFPVPAKLTRINIEVKVLLTQANKREPTEYSSSHQITVDSTVNTETFCNLYLRYSEKGYELNVLGRNGEPKKGVVLSFWFQNRYISQQINQSLQTDDSGIISLGPLEEIVQVRASLQTAGDISTRERTWSINTFKSLNYPTNMRICEGEQVILPLYHNDLSKHKISFVETLADGSVLRNLLAVLKIDKKKLIISGLKEGFYKLYLKDVKTLIYINVFKGSYWSQNPAYLYTRDTLIDIKNDINNIVVKEVKVEPKKDNAELADITIDAFADQPKLTRFHVYGMQFLEFDTNRMVTDMDLQLPSIPKQVTFLGLKQCLFLNNRNLGEEYCYVLDRRSQARFMGNTLEKPSILLKRTYVRETSTKEEDLSANKQFKRAGASLDEEINKMRCQQLEKLINLSRPAPRNTMGLQEIDAFTNFLANPCLISSNLKLDESGKIVLKNFPVKKFTMLKIVATNLTSNVVEIVPLKSTATQTKDLRQKARDDNSVHSINRTSNILLKGQKTQIKDMTSAEIQIVDSVGKLFDVQRNLVLSGNSNSTFYDKWSFLKEWEGLPQDQKLKIYDKFASHELNLFLFFKDSKFFGQVVMPFIQNKIEKTFIDYFLLNNDKKILEYAKVETLKDLNAVETALLVYRLNKIDPKQAKSLADSLEQMNTANNKVDNNLFKKYFDTALTVKKAQDQSQDPRVPPEPNLANLKVLQQARPLSPRNMIYQAPMRSMPKKAGLVQKKLERFDSADYFDDAKPQLNHSGDMSPAYSYVEDARSVRRSRSNSAYSADSRSGSEETPKRAGKPRSRALSICKDAGPVLKAAAREYGAQMRVADKSEAQQIQQLEDFDEKKVRAGFQELDKTKEYLERQYYENTNKSVTIPLNSFWIDVSKHIIANGFTKPFLSSNFIYAQTNQTEMIAALSVLSLPFKAGDHKQSPYEGRGIEIQAESDLVLLIKAVTEVESAISSEILVTQKFFDPREKYVESEEEPGLQVEKDVDQYVVDKVYGCTVIVTNLMGSNQQLQVLVEIPEGAIPLREVSYTKSHTVQLNAYSTQTIEFFFYFPNVGKFRANPPNVSKRNKVVARGRQVELDVKAKRSYATLETLNAVLTHGSEEDVLNFARTKNIFNSKVFDFNAIYWLLTNKDFFLKFVQILREKKSYNPNVWKFGFYHNDVQTMQEYFNGYSKNSLSLDVLYLNSSILKIDKFQLFEYHPLVNQRAHLLANEKNRILNIQLREQYHKYVKYLCERGKLESEHYLGLVYYLLLQDRIEEAIRFFAKIDREAIRQNSEYELQYDYFSAYIDFYMGYPNFNFAREVCKKYLNYPVLAWRSLFIDVANQLAEFDGKEVVIEDETALENKRKQNLTNAEKEEVVTLEVQKTSLNITHQNVKEITLAFYRVDLEVLFSRSPFINENKDEFSYIKPTELQKIEVPNTQKLEKLDYPIPENLKHHNLYIELRTNNKTLSATYFSTSLEVQIIESYGQIKVFANKTVPLPKVYVKCFTLSKNGKTAFYKDGYTDLRGRFDYATLSSSDVNSIEKFALFVMSDEYGSLIKEVKPPSKLGRVEDKYC